MTSCGRGRDSATPECFGRGEGRFSFKARNDLFSFQSYVRFEEFYCFTRFWKIWRQTFKLLRFWFRRCLGGIFENFAPSPSILCELRLRPWVFSRPWHFWCWSLRCNELECTDLVHWTGGHGTVFCHVLQLSFLFLCWKSTLTVILPQIKKTRSLSNVGHRGTKAENLAWHTTG